MRHISIAAMATTTVLAAATAGVGLLVTAPGASSADATKSSAYGISASAAGQEIVKQPYVESTDGSTKTTGGGSLPDNPLGLSATIAELTAGDDFASVEVTDLALAPSAEQLPTEVKDLLGELQTGCETLTEPTEDAPAPPTEGLPGIELPEDLEQFRDTLTGLIGEAFNLEDLTDFCESFDATAPLVTARALSVECEGDTGRFELVGLSFLGQAIPAPAVPQNEALLPDNPLLTITANQQDARDDGSFSIDGLSIKIGDGAAMGGEAVLANATCGEPIAAPATPDAVPAPPAAPAPTPVAGSAPVTG